MLRPWVAAVFLVTPGAALADACTAEIAALFEGGPLDPFVRPNRVETTVQVAPDGTETPMSVVRWDGPLKSINAVGGTFYMAIGTKAWQGPSLDGPWTFNGIMGDYDPNDVTRNTTRSMAANVTEASCDGAVDLDGTEAVKYSFRTKTDPNQFGSWWGGLYTVYIGAESGQKLREDVAEYIASWAPDPVETVQVTTVVYDDTIEIVEPAD